MALEWKLRKVMAEKNIWSGAELSRLLQDLAGYKLSAPSISALINEQWMLCVWLWSVRQVTYGYLLLLHM